MSTWKPSFTQLHHFDSAMPGVDNTSTSTPLRYPRTPYWELIRLPSQIPFETLRPGTRLPSASSSRTHTPQHSDSEEEEDEYAFYYAHPDRLVYHSHATKRQFRRATQKGAASSVSTPLSRCHDVGLGLRPLRGRPSNSSMVSRLHLDITTDSDLHMHTSAFRTAAVHHSPVDKESLMIVGRDCDDGGDGDSEGSSECSDYGYLSNETGLTSADAYQTVFFPQGQDDVKSQQASGTSSREAHGRRRRQEANTSSAVPSRKRKSLFRMFQQKANRSDSVSD